MSRLTRELVEAVHPGPIDDPGEAVELATEEELVASLAAFMAQRPGRGPVWVFAYGSLMWKPEVPVLEKRRAMLHGWHRRFCMWQWRHRATRERPNLMLALDRGGCCHGMVLRLPGREVHALMDKLWRREMIGRGYHARWVRVATPTGPVMAVAFVVRREGLRYAGRLPDEQVADYMARACGYAGSAAEYLLNTWEMAEQHGLGDAYLRRMQALVAARLRGMCTGGLADDRPLAPGHDPGA
jgi:cation transport protein ChaC